MCVGPGCRKGKSCWFKHILVAKQPVLPAATASTSPILSLSEFPPLIAPSKSSAPVPVAVSVPVAVVVDASTEAVVVVDASTETCSTSKEEGSSGGNSTVVVAPAPEEQGIEPAPLEEAVEEETPVEFMTTDPGYYYDPCYYYPPAPFYPPPPVSPYYGYPPPSFPPYYPPAFFGYY